MKITWVSFLAAFLLFDDFLLYNWGSSIFYIDYICQFQAIDPQIHKSANSTILGDYFSYVAINVVMICSNHLPYVAPNPHLGHFYSNCQVKVWRSSSNISWSFKIQYNAFMFYSCSPKKLIFLKWAWRLLWCFVSCVLFWYCVGSNRRIKVLRESLLTSRDLPAQNLLFAPNHSNIGREGNNTTTKITTFFNGYIWYDWLGVCYQPESWCASLSPPEHCASQPTGNGFGSCDKANLWLWCITEYFSCLHIYKYDTVVK